jgi:hypothetical protein
MKFGGIEDILIPEDKIHDACPERFRVVYGMGGKDLVALSIVIFSTDAGERTEKPRTEAQHDSKSKRTSNSTPNLGIAVAMMRL